MELIIIDGYTIWKMLKGYLLEFYGTEILFATKRELKTFIKNYGA